MWSLCGIKIHDCFLLNGVMADLNLNGNKLTPFSSPHLFMLTNFSLGFNNFFYSLGLGAICVVSIYGGRWKFLLLE